MSGNSGAWGVAMYKDGHAGSEPQLEGISLEGGDPVLPYLPTVPVGSLLLPPAGLGVPAVRSGDVTLAQRDGVVQVADYYEPRILTFQVLVQNDGCPGCSTEMSARQKVARLTQEWSRNCSGATLVLFTDCHDPNASEEEKIWRGPYLVHGRPRVADVVWERSNRGVARVTLRFDAADARLLLAQTDEGESWTATHTLFPSTNENRAQDHTLSTRSMSLNGATVSDSHESSGGPLGGNGGPYFERFVISPNTSSPMTMEAGEPGTAGIPVVAGEDWTVSWWARKNPGGGPSTRANARWADAAGALVSNVSGLNMTALPDWSRHSQTFTAPVGAAFFMPTLAWSGIALADQRLDLAQLWVNEGAVATEPDQIEVVGTLCVYPVFTLNAELTAPITVTYGSHEFTYNEDILDAPVVVDTRYGRAVQSGLDVTQHLTGDYSSPLEPGLHPVQIQTANPADNGSLSVRWENAAVSG